jgi:photosystem II stability/assembly factor-like uncharacterized protein
LAFSAADATRGYAAAFVNKQTQALYTTTDGGTTWQRSGTVQGPVGDFLSTDPLDPADVVMLSSYAPTPGAYTFQRSLDGGRTWSTQSTDLPTTGMVSQTGWSDATFLVGFQLDGQLQGSSAVVAFPKGQAGVHLDVNGKINGQAIPHLHLLTGRHNKITVWGDDGSAAQNLIGVATTDLGRSWASLPSTILGMTFLPTAATDDGATVLAVSEDGKRIAESGDDGDTWAALPSVVGAPQSTQGVFVTAKGKTAVVTLSDGTYTLHAGTWRKVTSKQVAVVSDGQSPNATRCWSVASRCSTGCSSGECGGRNRRWTCSGTRSRTLACHPAQPSHQHNLFVGASPCLRGEHFELRLKQRDGHVPNS